MTMSEPYGKAVWLPLALGAVLVTCTSCHGGDNKQIPGDGVMTTADDGPTDATDATGTSNPMDEPDGPDDDAGSNDGTASGENDELAESTPSAVVADSGTTRADDDPMPEATNATPDEPPASEPIPSDAELCALGCQLDPPRAIPGAMCEDWRVLDDTYEGEHCQNSGDATDCTGWCLERIEASSPPCQAALRRAIPCAANSQFYTSNALPMGCHFSDCLGHVVDVALACYGLRNELNAARELWNAVATDSYRFGYQGAGADGYSEIEVTEGVAIVVSGEPMDEPPTMPELFDTIESTIDGALAVPDVSYDAETGFPIEFAAVEYEGDYLSGSCISDVYAGFKVSSLSFK